MFLWELQYMKYERQVSENRGITRRWYKAEVKEKETAERLDNAKEIVSPNPRPPKSWTSSELALEVSGCMRQPDIQKRTKADTNKW